MIEFKHSYVEGGIVDRNLVWTSIHGVKTKIADMDDSYLANLYDYMSNRCKYHDLKRLLEEENTCLDSVIPFPVMICVVINELRKERGLKKEFMDRAQIPYKNPYGRWEIWDFKIGPVELEEAPCQ